MTTLSTHSNDPAVTAAVMLRLQAELVLEHLREPGYDVRALLEQCRQTAELALKAIDAPGGVT